MERMVAVNGFSVRAVYREESVRERFLPALHLWSRLAQKKGAAARLVVYLCAPPGAGKSTLAAYLEALSRETEGLVPLQALGMDGFHYKNSEMADKTVQRGGRLCPMKDFKGGPESFNVLKLEKALQRLGRGEKMRWPLYDRTLHDVVEDAIEVTGRIALVEGNWLLYRQMPWPRIHGLCDISSLCLRQKRCCGRV